MTGEKNIHILLASMQPFLNDGEYVFCCVNDDIDLSKDKIIMTFREKEGTTLILKKEDAQQWGFNYTSTFSWITLSIYSSLDAVWLTAAFSKALTKENISANVVAWFYHDHIFVNTVDTEKAMKVLNSFSKNIKLP